MNQSDYWIPVIAASGTVLASIITGFVAAALKRRWDDKDEEKRWLRQRDEHRREEVRVALLAYLEMRNAMESEVMEAFARVSRKEPAGRPDSIVAIMGLKRCLTALQLLLQQRASEQFGTDFKDFIAWYDAPPVAADASGEAISFGTPEGVRELARETLKRVPLA